MDAETLFTQALERVESKSIREWATTDHNRPIFIQLAEKAIAKNPQTEVCMFSAYITVTAIGL